MVKRTFLVCLTLLFVFSAQAQQRFRFGFRLSPLISLTSMQDKDKTTINGLDKSGGFRVSTGLMATYSLGDKVGIYSGLMFAFKGFKSSVEHTPPTIDNVAGTKRLITHNANLSYVEVPLALHLTSNEVTTGMKIRGLIGISLNGLVGANTTRNEYIIDIMTDDSYKLQDLQNNSNRLLTNTTQITVQGQPKSYADLAKTKSRSGTAGYNIFVPDVLAGVGVDWNIEGIGAFDFGISYHAAMGNISKYALRGSDRVGMSYLSFDIGYYF